MIFSIYYKNRINYHIFIPDHGVPGSGRRPGLSCALQIFIEDLYRISRKGQHHG